MSEQSLLKQIKIEQTFADYVYKDYRAKRYGMSPCCSIDQLQKYTIKKELCQWENKKVPIYSGTYEDSTSTGHTNTDTEPFVWTLNATPVYEWVQIISETGICAEGIGIGAWPPFSDTLGGCGGFLGDLNDKTKIVWYMHPDRLATLPNTSGTARLVVYIADADGDQVGIWEKALTNTTAITPVMTDIIVPSSTEWLQNTSYDALKIDVPRTSVGGTAVQCPSAGYTAGKNGVNASEVMTFYIVDGTDVHTLVWDGWGSWFGGASGAAWPCCPISNGTSRILDTGALTITKICPDTTPNSIHFCGMTAASTNGGTCVNDSECIYIQVVDQNGNPMKEFPIIIDGELSGYTNDLGVYKTTIINAGTVTKHILNNCHCFTTKGECRQQKILLTVNDSTSKEACDTPPAPLCT